MNSPAWEDLLRILPQRVVREINDNDSTAGILMRALCVVIDMRGSAVHELRQALTVVCPACGDVEPEQLGDCNTCSGEGRIFK